MGMPLAWRLASGMAWTLELNTRPRSVKNSAQSWVLATSRCADGVLLDRPGADDALAAARLAPVGDQRLALDVAAAGDGDDHVLVGDEVLVRELLVGVCPAMRVRRGPAYLASSSSFSSLMMSSTRRGLARMSSSSAMSLMMAMYSSSIFLRSSAARRRSCISRMALAWISESVKRLIRLSRAVVDVGRLADGRG